ncbi:MAG TPA: hypothetical protein VHZ54_02130 [Solirubrobacterales bacterium]|jgi:hypothetical protein|nr:hypothetical protein [Solirubrobacterales bacterium]
MTERQKVPLIGITDEQLAVVREEALEWLDAKAGDLARAGDKAAKREVEEVAALGRLVSGLCSEAIFVPDPIVGELVSREASQRGDFERVADEYHRMRFAADGWTALVKFFDGEPDSRDHDDGDDPPGREGWIDLDGSRISDAQLRIARRAVTGHLAGRTGDLHLKDQHEDFERELREVAALARLAFALERGEIEVPDQIAQEVAEGLRESVEQMYDYEEVHENHKTAVAEEGALAALVAIFKDDSSPSDDRQEGERSRP